jgi:hypothetical protein
MAEHSEDNSPKVPFEIDSASWGLIEKAYGASLPPNVRADVVRATEAFLFSQSFERGGEPIAKVKVILEAHEKAATRFFNELFGGASSFSDAGVYAHYLIDSNFKSGRVRSEKADLDGFLDLLRAFHIACNTAIKQLNDPSSGQKGRSWKIWLSRLAEAVAQVKSFGGDGSVEGKADHPFIQFVLETQKCLPPECRRDRALIVRAHIELRSSLKNL